MSEDGKIPCDRCGAEVAYGHDRDGRWLCGSCNFIEDEEVVLDSQESATCDCGAETNFRYKDELPVQMVFAREGDFSQDSERGEVVSASVDHAGAWVCPCCMAIFSDDEQEVST